MKPLGLFVWPYYPDVNLPHDLSGIVKGLMSAGGSNYLTDLKYNVGSRGLLSILGFLESKDITCSYLPLDFYQTRMNKEGIFDLIRSHLAKHQPRFIGLSSTTVTFPAVVEILNYCKLIDPEIIGIIGGYHVSFLDESAMLEAPAIDIVVRNEGEWTMWELAQLIVRNRLDFSEVRGITYRANGNKIVRNPDRPFGDLNELALPAYHLLPEELLSERFCTSIIPSRGCNYNCSFCVETRHWKNEVRSLPIDLILEEVKLLTETYKADVNFEDSIFLGWPNEKEKLYSLCNALSQLNTRFGYALLRVDLIDTEILSLLKMANISSIWVGAESSSDKVLQEIEKGISSNQMIQAFEKAVKLGIDVGTFWITGHPGDNQINSARTVRMMEFFLKEGLNARQENHIFVPFPGSPSFNNPEKFGMRILSRDWSRYHHNSYPPVVSYHDFSAFEIWIAYLNTLGMKARYYSSESEGDSEQLFYKILEEASEPMTTFVSTEKY